MAPASRSVEPPCVAPRRDAADLSGPPLAVVETITQARAPSTWQTYALKWSLFANWCSSRWEDPRRCTIRVVLSFLQERLECTWSFRSTEQLFVYHGGQQKGKAVSKQRLAIVDAVELAGFMLVAPLTRGCDCLFLLQFSSPVGEPWWSSSKHPRQSDRTEQSDARPSTGVSSPGSLVSPCTGLGVRMAWFPFGQSHMCILPL